MTRAQWSISRRAISVLTALVVTLALLPAVALAGGHHDPNWNPGEVGEEPADEHGDEETLDLEGEIRLLPQRIEMPDNIRHRTFWVWPEGRRLYTFLNVAHNQHGIVAFDLDTLREVQRREDLDFQLSPRPTLSSTAMDVENGRIFLGTTWGLVTIPPLQQQQIAVLDATPEGELATIRMIDLPELTIDGRPVLPSIEAMEYTPSDVSGGRGKLLVVAQENAHSPIAPPSGARPGENLNRSFVYQFDPDTGEADWAVELASCRGTKAHDQRTGSGQPDLPMTLFRSHDPATPVIYVGCHGTGRAGPARVVRIPLGPDGAPPFLPAEPGDALGAIARLVDGNPEAADDLVVRHAPVEVFPGPAYVSDWLADPASERLFLKVIDGVPRSETWWVFDGKRSDFVGVVGVGSGITYHNMTFGLDRTTGRLYVVGGQDDGELGGFLLADGRRTPLPQALRFSEFARHAVYTESGAGRSQIPLAVDPADGDRPTRVLFWPGEESVVGSNRAEPFILVFEDTIPVSDDPPPPDFADLTDDVAEVEGATRTRLEGMARGYGFRTLLVGGLEAVLRYGPLDASLAKWVGGGEGENPLRELDACSPLNRDVSFAFVGPHGPVLADTSGTSAAAEPVVVDSTTRSQSEVPFSSCSPQDWDELWRTLPLSQPPTSGGEPRVPWLFGDGEAACVASEEVQRAGYEESLTGGFAAEVVCGPDEVRGYAYARGIGAEDVSVAESSSTFRTYRDRERGVVSRVESVARGISIGGVVRIDSIRAVAESWANGRSQPDDIANNPDCDATRTAGTCFEVSISGMWTPGFSCAPCGDEEAFVQALRSALGDSWRVRLRQPDELLRRGSENGYVAGIQKPDHEQFADLTLNNDQLRTTMPALELVRYADGATGRGRQVFQFAGVEAVSTYGIDCLLTIVDGECAFEPATLQVALVDQDDNPLPGGVFELYRDGKEEEPAPPPVDDVDLDPTDGQDDEDSESDEGDEANGDSANGDANGDANGEDANGNEANGDEANGDDADGDGANGDGADDTDVGAPPTDDPWAEWSLVDPLTDTLVGDGACMTGADGVGDCVFEDLPPGSYIVHQVSAPPGYMAAPDFRLVLFEGDDVTVQFQTMPAVGAIEVNLTDLDGEPLEGGVFELVPDEPSSAEPDDENGSESETGADGDAADDGTEEQSAAEIVPEATCTTGPDGRCEFLDVDLSETGVRSFTVRQVAAPDGYLPSTGASVTLHAGELYRLNFTNAQDLGGLIEISLVEDASGTPLPGGTFEVWADLDDDGAVGENDTVYATCTTGQDGVCSFDLAASGVTDGQLRLAEDGAVLEVPLGSYVVRQTAAPGRFTPADDIAFALTDPGQRARVQIRNGAGDAAAGVASPPGLSSEPIVEGPFPYGDTPEPMVAPTLADTTGGLLQAPRQMLGLIAREPLQALALGALLLLFGAAVASIRRRMALIDLLG